MLAAPLSKFAFIILAKEGLGDNRKVTTKEGYRMQKMEKQFHLHCTPEDI